MLEELLCIFNAHTKAIMRQALELGAEMIFDAWYNCSESVCWSPAHWRELFLPHNLANVELTYGYGALYHYYDDGKMDNTLEPLAEVGVDVIETLSPLPLGNVDLASAKASIGDQVWLKGNVDQVNVILRDAHKEIREVVQKTFAVGAPGGGFILATSDSIRSETPWENVKAYFDAADEFGAQIYG